MPRPLHHNEVTRPIPDLVWLKCNLKLVSTIKPEVLQEINMAGRGRGRGSLTFDTVALGFGKGEALPAAMLQPPLLFPACLVLLSDFSHLTFTMMYFVHLANETLMFSLSFLLQ